MEHDILIKALENRIHELEAAIRLHRDHNEEPVATEDEMLYSILEYPCPECGERMDHLLDCPEDKDNE